MDTMKRWLWAIVVRLTGRRLLDECPMWCLGHSDVTPDTGTL